MNKVFVFALGAAAGSLVTWKLIEEKYKAIANDEVASVIEHFKKREEENNKGADVGEKGVSVESEIVTGHADDFPMEILENNEFTEEEKEEYANKVNDLGYDISKAESMAGYISPYVISPEEFGEFGNRTVLMTYYSDFTLVDEEGQIVSDPESIIGNALEHFGEYEDDSVHVRNEALECDYEILKSEKTFSEVYKEDD